MPLLRSGGAAISAGAAAGVGLAKRRGRAAYSALKEPTSAALSRGGVELAGHGGAYTLDRMFAWRAWGGWLRPSFFLGLGAFVLSALTGGKWSKMLLNAGAGVVHHYAARSFDKANNLLTPGAPSGTEGTEGNGTSAY